MSNVRTVPPAQRPLHLRSEGSRERRRRASLRPIHTGEVTRLTAFSRPGPRLRRGASPELLAPVHGPDWTLGKLASGEPGAVDYSGRGLRWPCETYSGDARQLRSARCRTSNAVRRTRPMSVGWSGPGCRLCCRDGVMRSPRGALATDNSHSSDKPMRVVIALTHAIARPPARPGSISCPRASQPRSAGYQAWLADGLERFSIGAHTPLHGGKSAVAVLFRLGRIDRPRRVV